MPKGSKGIRPVKLAIDIGAPIYPPESTTGRVSRKAVRDLTEELRGQIQELFDRSQERVGKPTSVPGAAGMGSAPTRRRPRPPARWREAAIGPKYATGEAGTPRRRPGPTSPSASCA